MSKSTREENVRADKWGIDLDFKDAFGKWHKSSQKTLDGILRAMKVESGEQPDDRFAAVMVVPELTPVRLPEQASITLENGERLPGSSSLPDNLPPGYHQLHFAGTNRTTRLIVAPESCYLPPELKTWGWAVQLYSARSRNSWGLGDLSDLRTLARWSAKQGAGMMLVNPLSAATPICPQQASPYYPTSRRFVNPLWLNIEWAAQHLEADPAPLETIAKQARQLNLRRLIDRDQAWKYKLAALEILWDGFSRDAAFDDFRRSQGEDLRRFATFCSLAEKFGCGWRAWPVEYRQPKSEDVAKFAEENANRVQFFEWIQWLLDRQLADCSGDLALMQDLPIGVDPGGADAWAWQEVLAASASVGAPPDEFNTQGQNWGLPPFIPHKLREAAYEPFIQTIRAAFRHGGGLRIDHVMGIFRLYWIPNGMSAAQGAYVRYHADEMLAIVALESQRAKAYVVGEDLGTVEDEVREKLAAKQILSYRLLWFEKDAPRKYPREALAAITTHDLPTVAGLWSGADLKKQMDLGLKPNQESTSEICSRLTRTAGLEGTTPVDEVIVRSYELLATAPSRIVTAALEDAQGVEERPNIPATLDNQNPNWSLALPLPIEELMAANLPARIAKALPRTESSSRPRSSRRVRLHSAELEVSRPDAIESSRQAKDT